MEEDRRLDLNQPFLSVRRFSPAVPSTESKDRSRKPDWKPPKVPQLPLYRSELKSGPLRKPGTVPFTWEQSPGRPKFDGMSPDQTPPRPPVVPKLPPGRTPNPKQNEPIESSNDREDDIQYRDKVPADNLVAKHEKPNETTGTGTGPGMEDGDETYYDAPDNLGRSESFFFNCSISGLSGLDGPDLGPAGTFATDPQVQDFMMGRFLPAAKAMASETPPHSHTPKRQPQAGREQPRLGIKKSSNVSSQHPIYRYNSSFLSHYLRQASGIESKDDEDDDTEPENSKLKVCGLLPRFLLKSSFCIDQDMVSQNAEKPNPKGKLSRTNRFAYKRDCRNMEVMTQIGHSQGNQNFLGKIGSAADQSTVEEDKGALEKGCTSFRDLLASEGHEWKSCSGSRGTVIERTLYIDSIRTGNSHNSDTSSVSGPPSYRGMDFDDKVKEPASVESLPQDVKEIDVVDEKEIPGDEAGDPVDSCSNKVEQTPVTESSHSEIDCIVSVEEKEVTGHTGVESIELSCSEPCKAGAEDRLPTTTTGDSGNGSRQRRSTFHIPPLLPKSPAESWLFRTLPSISSRNSPARFLPELTSRSSYTDPKRETIVRTTRSPTVSRPLAPAIKTSYDRQTSS